MPAETFSTVIDKLVELVYARGPISAKDAAEALAITEAQIEEMANVLAESGMLRVRYTLTGIFLEPKRMGVESAEKEVKGRETASDILYRTRAIEQALSDSMRSFQVVGGEIAKRIQKHKMELDQIEEAAQDANEQELNALLKDLSRIEKVVERFTKDLEITKSQLNSLREKAYNIRAKAAKDHAQKPPEKKEARKGLLEKLFTMLPIKRSG